MRARWHPHGGIDCDWGEWGLGVKIAFPTPEWVQGFSHWPQITVRIGPVVIWFGWHD